MLDVFPGEWIGTRHESELDKEITIGDKALVAVNSQFRDCSGDGEVLPRRLGQEGIVVAIDPGDEWAYKLRFEDGNTNWFKRYHLTRREE